MDQSSRRKKILSDVKDIYILCKYIVTFCSKENEEKLFVKGIYFNS